MENATNNERREKVDHADVLSAYTSLENSINVFCKPKKLVFNRILKWSLLVTIIFFVLFFATLMWAVWRPGNEITKLLSVVSLLMSMLSFLVFELAMVFYQIKAGLKENSFAILAGVKESINFNDQVVCLLSDVPTKALKMLKCDLVQECERRDINSYFFLGAATKLGILPSIYSIYLAYKNVFVDNEVTVGDLIEFDFVAQLYVIAMAIIVAIYMRTSIATAANNRMKRMIFWIDRALSIREENEA